MEFLKKMFGGGKKNGEGTFTCESCGQTRKLSEKKKHTEGHQGGAGSEQGKDKPKNVCEFC